MVVVHSFSRFCRDEFTYATAKRDLARAGIALHSLTQPLGDDHTGQMVSSILVSFDAYQSRENGKHTSRAMKENARQGFWNGSLPPFGYRTVEAGRRGEKVKKALAIFEPEADIVRRIFAMYLGVAGRQYGIKAIVNQGVSSEWGIMPRWPTARSGWHAAEIGGPILSRAFHCRPRSEPEAGDRHLFGTSASAATCSFAD